MRSRKVRVVSLRILVAEMYERVGA